MRIYILFICAVVFINGIQAQVKHRILTSGHGFQKIVLLDENKHISWEYPIDGQCNDLSMLSDSTILFSDVFSAKLINFKKEILWEYKGAPDTEIQSVSPLKNNRFLVMQNGNPAKLFEISRSGKITKELIIPTNKSKPHAQFRNVRKTKEGHYLIGYFHGDKVCEFSGRGKLLHTFTLPKNSNAYSAIRLKNGNTLIACGDAHQLIELNKRSEVVWSIKENDIPGYPLRFVAGVQRLKNGNTIICNWGGHGYKNQQAQIIEVTPDKKVVFEINDWVNLGTLSTCQVLDETGKMEKGKVYR